MASKTKAMKNTEKGQAIVEFAIVLPLLLIILCGILDFGWIYMNEYEVNHATYEAARYAAMHICDAGMTQEVLENNMRALVHTNLSHQSTDLSITITGLYSDDFPSISVVNPVHMLTFVGSTVFGSVYDLTVTNRFSVV